MPGPVSHPLPARAETEAPQSRVGELRLAVLAEKFPSLIQPWLLNSISEAVRLGAQVSIISNTPYGGTCSPQVEALGLLQRTEYFPLESAPDLLRALRRFLPFSGAGTQAWRGLARLIANGKQYPTTPAAWAKAIARSPLLAADFDVIHSHYLYGSFDYLFLARIRGVPLVTTFHGLQPKGIMPLPAHRAAVVFRHGTLFLVNTRFAQQQLESMGCPAPKIRILPQGIRLQDFPFYSKPVPSGERLVLLTVCRLTADKGLVHALDACARLAAAGKDFEYRMVGAGPQRPELEALIARLALSDRVRLLGELDDAQLHRQYADAHIFILPSVPDPTYHVETQGVVMQEAQASGCLVVAASTGGIPECLDDGTAGFLVPPRDAQALAAKIEFLLAQPEMWRSWQQAGRAWVERHFALPAIGTRLMALYEEAITLASRARRLD